MAASVPFVRGHPGVAVTGERGFPVRAWEVAAFDAVACPVGAPSDPALCLESVDYVASRGPLHIPPSEQGQPVVFHAGGSPNAHQFAGRWANAVIGAAFTIDDARMQRAAFRNAATRADRNPDEIKFFAGLMTSIASDKRQGLDRRSALSGRTFPERADGCLA